MDEFLSSSTNLMKPYSKSTSRVMIVDDHEIFRHGLRDLLNSTDGFQVVAEAGSCKDAVVQMEMTSVDTVLLDLHLPDSDGIETIVRLREFVPSPQIIILSATIDDDMLLDAMLAGACGYLTKDTSASDIIKALQGFQRGEIAMLPTVAAHVVRLLVQQCQHIEEELFTYIKNHANKSDLPPSEVSPMSSSNSSLETLTPQEEKVFQLMRKGLSNKQIAAHLSISPFTVGKHVQNIFRKLGVTNRTQAVSYTAFEGGS